MTTLYEDLQFIWKLLERVHDDNYELINHTNMVACYLIIKVVNKHGLKPKEIEE